MRAAVIQQFGSPLVIEDRPVAEPGRGQIRVKIETSGVCHTDIHAAHGDWPIRPTLPLVPGHEGVGLVDALGDGVDRVSLGQRVAIPWLGSADGTCEFCVKGLETYCVTPTFTGYTVDGGYREYSIADARFVGLVPEGVDPLDAAPLTCAGVTTYKAVKAAKVGPSDLAPWPTPARSNTTRPPSSRRHSGSCGAFGSSTRFAGEIESSARSSRLGSLSIVAHVEVVERHGWRSDRIGKRPRPPLGEERVAQNEAEGQG